MIQTSVVKKINEIISDEAKISDPTWDGYAIINDDNMTYVIANKNTKEAIIVDPMREDWEAQLRVIDDLKGYRWLAVIDTHTHADHISNTRELSEKLKAPIVMHALAPSPRVHLRVARDVDFSAAAAPLKLLVTPGHTQDCITVIWGPFVMTGDTIIYGDTGRDDLPTGNPTQHYESLLKIKSAVRDEMIFLPGHDGKGRASSWKAQLKENGSLNQSREDFIRDASSYTGPSPKNLKESLFENFK